MKMTLPKLIAVGITSTLSLNAFSQSAFLEEIVVTAQKVEESINDVPMSITAVTGEQLENRGITSVEDLTKIVPGFSFQPAPYGNQTFNLRGIGNIDDSLASSATVALYIDQAPLPYSVMGQGLAFDVERVEVLKGPQGTLFGQNSTGGAINFIANKPGDEFEAGLRAGTDTYGEVEFTGHISGALSGNVGARLAVMSQSGGAWQKSQSRPGDELGDKDFAAARLILDWQASDNLSFSLNLNGWDNQGDTQAAQLVRSTVNTNTGNPALDAVGGLVLSLEAAAGTAGAPRENSELADWNDTPLKNDDSFSQAALTATYDINDDVTLTSITSSSDYEQFILIDVDGTPFNHLTQRQKGTIESLSQELRLNGTAGESTRWMLGANYSKDDVDMNAFASLFGTNSFFPNLLAGPGDPPSNDVASLDPTIPSVDNLNRQDITTTGLFAGIDHSLTDSLTARASVRYTEIENNFEGCFRDTGDGRFATAINGFVGAIAGFTVENPGDCITADFSTMPATAGLVERTLDEDNVAFRVGLDWVINDDDLIYANITRGFKSGAFPNVPAIDASQNSPSPQEELLAYELGFKSTVSDSLLIDGSVFFYDYENKQLTGSSPTIIGNLRAAVSAPEAEVTGLEISAKWAPTDNLFISLGGTYLDAEIISSEVFRAGALQQAIDSVGNNVDLAGTGFPTTPDLTWQADVQYEFSLFGSNNAYVGLSANYRDDAQAQLGGNPEFLIESYTLIDARLGVTVNDNLSVELWGQNITDEFYVTSKQSVIGTLSQLTGRPATFGITLDYEF